MNLDDAVEREELAAEYVLGTLAGTDRSRFEKALDDDAGLCALVSLWEARLAGLAAVVPPEAPPPEVWERVRNSLAGTAPAAPETVEHSSPPTPQELMERSVRRLKSWLRVWQGATAAAVAAALALLVYQGLFAQRPPAVQLLAVLQPVTAGTAWLIQARADGATVRPISAPPLPSDRSFELWLMPGTGTPASLGLLSGERATVLDLGPTLRQRLSPDTLLAVSIEPSGGSRTGAPTGPVVYSGRLTSLALGPDGQGGGNASRESQSLPTQLTTPQRRQ